MMGASASLSAIKSSINYQSPTPPVNAANNVEIQNTTTSTPTNSAPVGTYVMIGFGVLILLGVVVYFKAK